MKRILGIALCAALLVALPAVAGAGGGVSNWNAPATWSPGASASSAGRTALAVSANPLPFIPVAPCRVADTRAGSGFPASYGPPSIGSSAARTFVIPGKCGIPATALAVSFNFAVWNTTSYGDFNIFPAGAAVSTVSTLNWGPGVLALANAAVIPLGTAGGITVLNESSSTVDLFFDVNGYYSSEQPGGNTFFITSSVPGGIMGWFENFATTSTNYGVLGYANGGTAGNGVLGQGTSRGVWGYAYPGSGAAGVVGDAISSGNTGVGVYGHAITNNGVRGLTDSSATDAAGIFGTDGTGAAGGLTTGWFSAGGKFWGKNGVIGVTNTGGGDGVVGAAISPATTAVIAFGNFSASGTKAFIEPHPTDPAKEIRFVALEGNEAGTYFRAKANVKGGFAEVVVPESFRIVTDPESLTVHVTSVGRAQTWIESSDLNTIVVGASRDVPVNVIVYGVRHAFRDWQVISENKDFRPTSADQKMPGYLTEEAKSRLIANGTYNADGTVNLQTAERVGWAQQWRDEAAAELKARDEASLRAAAEGPPGTRPQQASSKP